jgi:thioredoxin reductase
LSIKIKVFLSQAAIRVHMLVRVSGLAESMSRYLIRRIEQNPAIVLRTHTEVVALEGSSHLERLRWWDDQAGSIETHDIRHVFVMTGAVPSTEWLDGCVALDAKGFIKTGPDLSQDDLAARQGSPPSRNESARSVRRRQCPGWQYQACRVSSGRGFVRWSAALR